MDEKTKKFKMKTSMN